MDNYQTKKNGGFFNLIKNLFILLLFIQFAPMVFMNLKKYIKDAMVPRAHVGSLSIKGFIGGSDFYVKRIQKFLKDPEIKALFLNIDSPGGLPGTAQAIFSELNKFKKEKPVVVFVENFCTSAAYYIAIASDRIIVTPSSLMGGVGVLLQLPNVKGLLNNWKVKFDYIQSGEFKTAGSPLKENTPAELEYLQKLSDGNYEQFLKDVSVGRNLDKKDYKIWADGKVFLGVDALKLKLVDQIGGYQDAIDEIKKLASIETEIKFIKPKKASSIYRLFFGDEDDNDNGGASFSSKCAVFLSDVYDNFYENQIKSKKIDLV